MYALLDSGYPASFVNGVLEVNGQQRDGLVVSEIEVAGIMSRIDAFNATLAALTASAGPNVHLVEIGEYLSDVLTGEIDVVIGGHQFNRKWMRGSAFTFDGVHPGYTGQALISNFVLARINQHLGTDAPMTPLGHVFTTDPYIDRDGDGFAAGPGYLASGITEVLFLFKDPDDTNAAIQPDLPENVWELIAAALLEDVLGRSEAMRVEARRLGIQ
jgi:hypothetical protein